VYEALQYFPVNAEALQDGRQHRRDEVGKEVNATPFRTDSHTVVELSDDRDHGRRYPAPGYDIPQVKCFLDVYEARIYRYSTLPPELLQSVYDEHHVHCLPGQTPHCLSGNRPSVS